MEMIPPIAVGLHNLIDNMPSRNALHKRMTSS